MFRRLLVCVLAVAALANSASANLSLVITPDESVEMLLPGQEVRLVVSLQWDAPDGQFQSFDGIDFRINSGSDATFQATEFLIPDGPGTVGAWVESPPAGGPIRDFTGGPTPPFNFGNPIIPGLTNGDLLLLGSIVLRAGSTGNWEVFFENLEIQDAANLPINNAIISRLSYSVVPEPSAALLSLVGLTGLLFRRRRSA